MKKIGLLGGVGWPSTVDYYRIINEACNAYFGDLTSPEIIVYSVNFKPLIKFQHANDLKKAADYLKEGAISLEKAGADIILICSATTNLASELLQMKVKIPILNIAETTAKQIKKENVASVLLLGTNITMENTFFPSWLNKYNIKCIVPDKNDKKEINRIIYEELCFNIILPSSKDKYLSVINNMVDKNKLEGVVLGCTEIPMLINQDDLNIKVFDITKLHALAAFNFSIGK